MDWLAISLALSGRAATCILSVSDMKPSIWTFRDIAERMWRMRTKADYF